MNSQITRRPIEILLVEDNPGDVRLTVEALRDSKIQNRLHIVRDGIEAVAFLRRKGKHSNAPHPDLILLDLNLPKMDGPAVLVEIKEDTGLKHIPVVILTGSEDIEDITKTYNLHANCYVTKPINLEQFIMVVKSVRDFWLTIVKLPTEER